MSWQPTGLRQTERRSTRPVWTSAASSCTQVLAQVLWLVVALCAMTAAGRAAFVLCTVLRSARHPPDSSVWPVGVGAVSCPRRGGGARYV